jgi:hypothetical protein
MATPRLRFLEQVASHADPWDVLVERSALEEAFALDVLNKSLVARSQIEQLDKGVTLKRSGAKHTANPIKAKAALERANAIRVGSSRAAPVPTPEEQKQAEKKQKKGAAMKHKSRMEFGRCAVKGCPYVLTHPQRQLVVYCPQHERK